MSLLDSEIDLQPPSGMDWTGSRGVKIDMHCHSTYSLETLSLLPTLSWNPVLTPGELYDLAKARGMDYVTITDHDTIDGCKALVDERGDLPDFFFGEEVSAALPDNGTVVHVNVFDINEEQHAEVRRLRSNLFEMVDYLRRLGKVCSINHLTWTEQHRVLTSAQIDAILHAFDVFEGINGTRSYAHNAFVWQATRGWGKTLIAGSDTHTDRVGSTYTLTKGRNRQEVLENIRAGLATPHGAFGTPEKLRDDVWAVLQCNIERRMAEATGHWERLVCRTLRRIGKTLHPLVLLGYHKHQDVLIRGFVRSLPTLTTA